MFGIGEAAAQPAAVDQVGADLGRPGSGRERPGKSVDDERGGYRKGARGMTK